MQLQRLDDGAALLALAQADEVTKQVPIAPNRIAAWPAMALAMIFGINKGLTRLATHSICSTLVYSISSMPPMPVPVMQPPRVRSSRSMSSPLAFIASSAATR